MIKPAPTAAMNLRGQNSRKRSLKTIAFWVGMVILFLLALLIALLAISQWTLSDRMDSRIAAFVEADKAVPRPNTDVDIADLPAPLQRYWATALGGQTHAVRGVVMHVDGRLKLPGTDEWLPITGQQYISALRPAFLWNIRATIYGPLWVDVQDHYGDCTGHINTKAFSLYPLLDEKNIPELTITQLSRWSGLIVMTPPALINNPYITWHPVDDNSAIAVIEDCDIRTEHLFTFDDEGLVVRVESADRYELYEGRGYEKIGSVMHRTEYRTIDGLSVPIKSSIIRIEDGVEIEFLNEIFTELRFVR